MTKVRDRTKLKIAAREWTAFVEQPITAELRARFPFLAHCESIRVNSRFEVQLYPCGSSIGGVMQADIRRHADLAPITFRDLQRIKLELFGPEAVAIEVFPRPADEWPMNAEIRVLWILPSSYQLPVGLHLPNAWGRSVE